MDDGFINGCFTNFVDRWSFFLQSVFRCCSTRGLLGGRTSLPPLFDSGTDSVRSTVKPGAALAVASAVAFKSRRALSANLHNQELAAKAVEGPRGSDVSNDGFNSIASETDQSNEKVVQEDVQWDNYQSAVVDVSDEFSAKEDNGESQEEPAQSSQFDKLRFSDSQKISTSSYIEPNVNSPIQPDENLDLEENATVSVSDDFPDGQVPSSLGDENNGVISEFVEASEIAANGMVSSPGSSEGRSMENKMEIAMLEASELERVMPCSRDEVSLTGDDTSCRNDVIDLDVDIINQLESKRITKRTEKKSRSSVKPLELAEDLEKKHAYSGLDWENDIAAQPMRLEGIQWGSTALGYFDVDANNTSTRTISTQAFRRDQGSPQVMAVHLNFIAVGMSKGVVLVIPSIQALVLHL